MILVGIVASALLLGAWACLLVLWVLMTRRERQLLEAGGVLPWRTEDPVTGLGFTVALRDDGTVILAGPDVHARLSEATAVAMGRALIVAARGSQKIRAELKSEGIEL